MTDKERLELCQEVAKQLREITGKGWQVESAQMRYGARNRYRLSYPGRYAPESLTPSQLLEWARGFLEATRIERCTVHLRDYQG